MRKLIFIHPDHKLIDIYHRHLSPHFNIDSAHDGLAGLRLIKMSQPHAIISDYNLPFLSGLSLLKFVRAHETMRTTPFIFLTRSEMPYEALGMGATAWLRQGHSEPNEILNMFEHIRNS